MRDLFAESIGMIKNPASHRDPELDDPGEVAEAILFANSSANKNDRRVLSLEARD